MVLGQVIAAYRESRKLSYRELEQEIRLDGDHTALYRLEHGKSIDVVNFGKILLWLLRT